MGHVVYLEGGLLRGALEPALDARLHRGYQGVVAKGFPGFFAVMDRNIIIAFIVITVTVAIPLLKQWVVDYWPY